MRPLSLSLPLRAGAIATALAFSPFASAGLVAATTGNATVQGSPVAPQTMGGMVTNVILAAPSGNTSNANQTQTSPTNGTLTITFKGEAATVNTSIPAYAAAPVNSMSTTASPFLSTNTTSANATAYSGSPNATGGTLTGGGDYVFTFTTPQAYLGLLWGSIGSGDLLSFYNGTTLIGTVNGTTAAAAGTNFNPANGSQNYGGSQFELVNFLGGGTTGTFTSVVFSQTVQAAFEASNFQYSIHNVSPVPEPESILLLGIGLVGIAAARRKAIAA